MSRIGFKAFPVIASLILLSIIQTVNALPDGLELKLTSLKEHTSIQQLKNFYQIANDSFHHESTLLAKPNQTKITKVKSSSNSVSENQLMVDRLILLNKDNSSGSSQKNSQHLLHDEKLSHVSKLQNVVGLEANPESLKKHIIPSVEDNSIEKQANPAASSRNTPKGGKLRYLDKLQPINENHKHLYHEQLNELQKKKTAIEANNQIALIIGFGLITVLTLVLIGIYYLVIKRRMPPGEELAEEDEADNGDSLQYWDEYIESLAQNPQENPQQVLSPLHQDESLKVSPGWPRGEFELKDGEETPKIPAKEDPSLAQYKKVNEESRLDDSAVVGYDSVIQNSAKQPSLQ